MHAVTFHAKMLHWKGVRFGRMLMEGTSRFHDEAPSLVRYALREHMTPARFDLLSAVLEGGPERRQSTLPDHLGVCRATVSVMIQKLESLGWLRRQPAPHDRRTLMVSLTDLGRDLLALARSIVEDATIGYPNHFRSFVRKTQTTLHSLFLTIHTLARHFGNHSTYKYSPPNPPSSPHLVEITCDRTHADNRPNAMSIRVDDEMN
jgi:DNA-binding MarR family transcriptional regulator